MTSTASVHSIRKKLESPSSIVSYQSVCAFFNATSISTPFESSIEAIVKQCLIHSSKDVVQEALQQLCTRINHVQSGLSASHAIDLVLAALTTAGSANVDILGEHLVQLVMSDPQGSNQSGASGGSSHPLSSALLIQPACGPFLIQSCCRKLRELVCDVGGDAQRTLFELGIKEDCNAFSSLKPFFTFVLLQKGMSLCHIMEESVSQHSSASGSTVSIVSALKPTSSQAASDSVGLWTLLPGILHQELAGLALNCPWLGMPILHFLCKALSCGSKHSLAERLKASQEALVVILDVATCLKEQILRQPYDTVGLTDNLNYLVLYFSNMLLPALLSFAIELQLRPPSNLRGALEAALRAQAMIQSMNAAQRQLHHKAELKSLEAVVDQAAPACVILNDDENTTTGQRMRLTLITHLLSHQSSPQDKERLFLLLFRDLKFSSTTPRGSGPQTRGTASLVPSLLLCRHHLLLSLAYKQDLKERKWASNLTGLLNESIIRHTSTAVLGGRDLGASRGRGLSVDHKSNSGLSGSSSVTNVSFTNTMSVLAVLLQHPVPAVCIAVSRVVGQLILHQPLAALHFLPTVLTQLQSVDDGNNNVLPQSIGYSLALQSTHDNAEREIIVGYGAQAAATGVKGGQAIPQILPAGHHAHPSTTVVSTFNVSMAGCRAEAHLSLLLNVLPALSMDASVAPYAAKAIAPLSADSSPVLLRCLYLRVVVEGWLKTGRGWPKVEATLNGYCSKPMSGPKGVPLELRLTRIGLIRSVVLKDPSQGLELVSAIQDAVQDSSPLVSSLSLNVLREMCDAGVLDFYKAWKVVHRIHPQLPKHPLLAASWVDLMSQGAVDAASQPTKALAIMQALWASTRHPDLRVQKAAFRSLAAFPLDMLEQLQANNETSDQADDPNQEHYTDAAASAASASASAAMMPPVIDVLPYIEPILSSPLVLNTGHGDGGLVSATGSSTDAAAEHANSRASLSPQIEVLAGMALNYEHDNRRRLFLATGTDSTAAFSVSNTLQDSSSMIDSSVLALTHGLSSSSSSQPSIRDAASVVHRLVHTLPAQLLSSNTHLNNKGILTTSVPALLLLDDPKPAASAGSRATATTSKHDIASSRNQPEFVQTASSHNKEDLKDFCAFRSKLHLALTHHHLLLHNSNDWWQEGLVLHTWSQFFNRWLQVCQCDVGSIWVEISLVWGAGQQQTMGPHVVSLSSNRINQEPISTPMTSVNSSIPLAVLEAAPFAAAALCLAGRRAGMLSASLLEEVFETVLSNVTQQPYWSPRSSASIQGTLRALTLLTELLPPSDVRAKSRVIQTLLNVHSDTASQYPGGTQHESVIRGICTAALARVAVDAAKEGGMKNDDVAISSAQLGIKGPQSFKTLAGHLCHQLLIDIVRLAPSLATLVKEVRSSLPPLLSLPALSSDVAGTIKEAGTINEADFFPSSITQADSTIYGDHVCNKRTDGGSISASAMGDHESGLRELQELLLGLLAVCLKIARTSSAGGLHGPEVDNDSTFVSRALQELHAQLAKAIQHAYQQVQMTTQQVQMTTQQVQMTTQTTTAESRLQLLHNNKLCSMLIEVFSATHCAARSSDLPGGLWSTCMDNYGASSAPPSAAGDGGQGTTLMRDDVLELLTQMTGCQHGDSIDVHVQASACRAVAFVLASATSTELTRELLNSSGKAMVKSQPRTMMKSSGDTSSDSIVGSPLVATHFAHLRRLASDTQLKGVCRMDAFSGLFAVLTGITSELVALLHPAAHPLQMSSASANEGYQQAMVAGRDSSSGLLGALPESTHLSRSVIRDLESALKQQGGADGRVSAYAAWLLAAACQTIRVNGHNNTAPSSSVTSHHPSNLDAHGQHSDKGVDISLKSEAAAIVAIPLSQYPQHGAHRPIVERLKTLSASPSFSLSHAMRASTLARCLAVSPRLPSADWGSLCIRLWRLSQTSELKVEEHSVVVREKSHYNDYGVQDHTSSPAVSQSYDIQSALQCSLIQLAVTHSSIPSHRLLSFLSEISHDYQQLMKMHERALALFLRSLHLILKCLPLSQFQDLLSSVVSAVRSGVKDEGCQSVLVSTSDQKLDMLFALGSEQEDGTAAEPLNRHDNPHLLCCLLQGLNELTRLLNDPVAKVNQRTTSGSAVSTLKAAVQNAVVDALRLLPQLPALHPAELDALMNLIKQSSTTEQGFDGLSSTLMLTPPALGQHVVEMTGSCGPGPSKNTVHGLHLPAQKLLNARMDLWCHATRCLISLGSDADTKISSLVGNMKTGIQALQMLCLLCLMNKLHYTDLTSVRSYLLSTEASVETLSSLGRLHAEVMLHAPQAAQFQLLQDLLGEHYGHLGAHQRCLIKQQHSEESIDDEYVSSSLLPFKAASADKFLGI
ncbi:hypothetical protein CEUSTIGMA_g13374.t1 [Chlamydomonas eustigma]|uniref:DUF3730 domain-containing protein n=1 Tax=Chlamydomonas eustigma TaxID=1157962 RepID=A0A250XSB8_9CHLO|nr:hypothetical protein CEUSTIGMA_g13374.t1 [Chlamydomonas eustigma]|eukprot:GAX85958.1 hypothetical protein CEUSTIGMA_g13374.t1 [Chlamydomonas eustigma]